MYNFQPDFFFLMTVCGEQQRVRASLRPYDAHVLIERQLVEAACQLDDGARLEHKAYGTRHA